MGLKFPWLLPLLPSNLDESLYKDSSSALFTSWFSEGQGAELHTETGATAAAAAADLL